MFRTIASIIILSTTAITATGPLQIGGPAPLAPANPETATQVIGRVSPSLPADKADLVEWARGRFSAAGMELPSMTVRFDPTKQLCNNNEGLYHYDGNEHQVTICIRDSESFAAELERRRTLLHEFAHAWETVNLTDDDRTQLNKRFGVTAWNDENEEWSRRGAEQLAETFVFGLLDQARRQTKLDVGCHELAASFTAVTGLAPLGPDQPWCVAEQQQQPQRATA